MNSRNDSLIDCASKFIKPKIQLRNLKSKHAQRNCFSDSQFSRIWQLLKESKYGNISVKRNLEAKKPLPSSTASSIFSKIAPPTSLESKHSEHSALHSFMFLLLNKLLVATSFVPFTSEIKLRTSERLRWINWVKRTRTPFLFFQQQFVL